MGLEASGCIRVLPARLSRVHGKRTPARAWSQPQPLRVQGQDWTSLQGAEGQTGNKSCFRRVSPPHPVLQVPVPSTTGSRRALCLKPFLGKHKPRPLPVLHPGVDRGIYASLRESRDKEKPKHSLAGLKGNVGQSSSPGARARFPPQARTPGASTHSPTAQPPPPLITLPRTTSCLRHSPCTNTSVLQLLVPAPRSAARPALLPSVSMQRPTVRNACSCRPQKYPPMTCRGDKAESAPCSASAGQGCPMYSTGGQHSGSGAQQTCSWWVWVQPMALHCARRAALGWDALQPARPSGTVGPFSCNCHSVPNSVRCCPQPWPVPKQRVPVPAFPRVPSVPQLLWQCHCPEPCILGASHPYPT